MNRGRKLALCILLGLCAYGLGLLLGKRVDQTFRRHAAGENSRLASIKTSRAPAAPDSGDADADATNSQTSAFLPNPERTLEIFCSRVRELDRAGRWTSQVNLVMPMVFALATNDYPKAWAVIGEMRLGDVRGFLQARLIQAWSKHDPPAALACALALPEVGNARGLCLQNIWLAWGEKDPDAAVARARQLPSGQSQTQALYMIVQGVANRNAAAAAQLLAALPLGRDRTSAAEQVAQRLAPTDPEAAARLLEETASSGTFHEISMGAVAGAMAEHSLPETIAWGQNLTNTSEQVIALGAVVNALLRTNSTQAAQFVLSQADAKIRAQLAGHLVRDWAALDVQSAADWVTQLQPGPVRRQALEGLRNFWSWHDPEAAASFALTSLTSGQDRKAMLQDIGRSWYFMTRNEQPVQFAEQMNAGPERDAFLSGLCSALVGHNPEEAARLALSMSPGKGQSEAIRSAALVWAAEDPASAAAWSSALSVGETRIGALPAIGERWARVDPAACAEWLQSLPADDARAKAAESFVALTAGKRPELAAQWVEAITDETKRNAQIEAIASKWSKTDSVAAMAWLRQTSLPSERKETLQAK